MYPQVHSGGSSSRCLTENSIAVSIYSSHLNFRRCYRLTRHPHVPSSTLRWLVVAVPSRKFHCCEYTLRWLVVAVPSRKSHCCEYTLRWLVVAVSSRKSHCCEYR